MKIIFIIISILYGFKFNLNFYLGSHNLYAKAVYELYDESKITYEQLNGPVGIYAGSFDPPILGHKEIIIKAIKNYNLQILLL